MSWQVCGMAALATAAGLWVLSGTQHERPLLSGAARETLCAAEALAALHPDAPGPVAGLATAYVDAEQSGLAVALVEGAGPEVRADVRVMHAFARALVDQGRNQRALAVEREVVASCRPLADGRAAPDGCGPTLLALAVRRTAILGELVALGVEDSGSAPEESLLAYRNATREVAVAVP